VINDVIMSDADCTPGREPRSVAASLYSFLFTISGILFMAGKKHDSSFPRSNALARRNKEIFMCHACALTPPLKRNASESFSAMNCIVRCVPMRDDY